MQQLERLEKTFEEFGVVEQRPKLEGRQAVMVLGPKRRSNSQRHWDLLY